VELTKLAGRVDGIEGRLRKVERYCEEDSPEFHRRMEKFVSTYEGAQAERDKMAMIRHQENIERFQSIKRSNDNWNLIITIVGVLIAGCMLYLTAKSAFHAKLDPADLFHVSEQGVYAQNHELANW